MLHNRDSSTSPSRKQNLNETKKELIQTQKMKTFLNLINAFSCNENYLKKLL